MQIKINLQIFIFIIIFILTQQIEIYAWMMLFAFLHEMGHIVVGILLGLKPKSLHINPFGLTVLFETYSKKKIVEIKKIFIAISGPLTNLLIVIITMFLNINANLKDTIIYSNILIGIFNMLPLYPLDGGRMLKSCLKLKYNELVTDKIVNQISNIIVIILTIATSILILYFKNIALLFIIIYLWIIVLKENRKYNLKRKVYNIIQREQK